MKNTKLVDTRVAVCRLVIALALIAVPSMALTDRSASAHSAPAAPVIEAAASNDAAAVADESSAFDAAAWQEVEVGAIDPKVFALALNAASTAVARGEANPGTLTVIDFSKPSTEKRMWVFDLRARALMFEELVSHGRGSGRTLATEFSNTPESNRSSLGLYRTAETYIGKHGYSLRLDGLERGFNDRARERAIVMHAADYVNGAAAKAQGFLGRSLGCPAVRPEVSRQLIDSVKGGGLVFAYYPDPQWLQGSRYLNP